MDYLYRVRVLYHLVGERVDPCHSVGLYHDGIADREKQKHSNILYIRTYVRTYIHNNTLIL